MKRLSIIILAALTATSVCLAQAPNDDLVNQMNYLRENYRQVVRIPDFGGFQTLKCDLHTHTVYSDGLVWPSIRVDEAWWDGLDAVAITDHIEYRPRKEKVLGDSNESYVVASSRGKQIGMLVIPGTEITHSKPDGHLNALFIKDANKINLPKTIDQIEAACAQDAVVMLNHPGWPDNVSTIDTMHIRLFKEGKIQLIEVDNCHQFYPRVCGWMKEYHLGPAASSDIHNLIGRSYGHGLFRPMTLVLAKERSLEGIKEALLARRTIAFFNQNIAGEEQYLKGLFEACISIKQAVNDKEHKRAVIELANNSDVEFDLAEPNGSSFILYPNQVYRKTIKYDDFKTIYEITNAHTGLNEHLKVVFPLTIND